MEEKEALVFFVNDNGIGMSPEVLNDVRFHLSEVSLSSTESGYGLYNVNRRLNLYYGEDAYLKIESTYNQGTCVTIRVPKKQPTL